MFFQFPLILLLEAWIVRFRSQIVFVTYGKSMIYCCYIIGFGYAVLNSMQFESNQQGFNTNRIYAWTDFIISHAQVPIKKEKRKKSFVCTVYVGFFFFIMGGQSREMVRHQEFEKVEQSERRQRVGENDNKVKERIRRVGISSSSCWMGMKPSMVLENSNSYVNCPGLKIG